MKEISLYHGSTNVVECPICAYGRENLDFGRGFYLTDIRTQAESWSRRLAAGDEEKSPILNIYDFCKDGYLAEGRAKIFTAYDKEWLEFIVESRQGGKPWLDFDYIEGGVANDRVIDTVNLYIAGLMGLETALGRLSMHHPNNQICLLNQALTDKFLRFKTHERL